MLLVRPIPQPEESPVSILMRAATMNGWANLDCMLSAHRIVCSRPDTLFRQPKRFNKIASALGIGTDQFEGIFATKKTFNGERIQLPGGIELPGTVFRADGAAVCPECLQQASTTSMSIDWTNRLLLSCKLHGCALIRRCPDCDAELSWCRRTLHTCDCGFNLRNSPRRTENIAVTSRIAKAIASIDQVFLNATCDAFVALDTMCRQDSIEISDETLVTVSISARDDIAEFLEAWLCTHVSSIHPRLALLPFLKRDDWLKELALDVLQRIGGLTIPPKSDVLLEGYVTAADTAWVIGSVKHSVVYGLGDRSILERKYHTRDARSQRYSRASVDLLMRRIWRAPMRQDFAISRPRPLTIALPELIAKLLEIPNFAAGYELYKGVAGVRVLPDRSTEGVDDSSRDLISIAEAEKQFDLYARILRSLVCHGYLKAHKDPTFGRRVLLSKCELRRFNDDFVFAGALARSVGANPTNFIEKLYQSGISPIGGPGIDGLLLYLVRKCDIAGIDLQALKSQSAAPFDERMCRKLTDVESGVESDYMSISAVANEIGLRIGEIVKLTRKGILCRVQSSQRAVSVSKKSFDAFKAEFTDKTHVNVITLAKEIGESVPELTARWVTPGIVKLIDLGVYRVLREADANKIKEWKSKYMTAKDAALFLNKGRYFLPNLEHQGKIASLRLGKNGKLRLYRKESVLPFIDELSNCSIASESVCDFLESDGSARKVVE